MSDHLPESPSVPIAYVPVPDPLPPTLPDVPAWNPYKRTAETTHPLECSGGVATITLRPWSTSERLAYEDASAIRALTTGPDGKPTARFGTLQLIAVALTAVRATGFPPVELPDGSTAPFDPSIEAHLLSLDPDTYGEVRELAMRVQPLPGGKRKSDDAEDAADAGEGEDPSPAPQTPRVD